MDKRRRRAMKLLVMWLWHLKVKNWSFEESSFIISWTQPLFPQSSSLSKVSSNSRMTWRLMSGYLVKNLNNKLLNSMTLVWNSFFFARIVNEKTKISENKNLINKLFCFNVLAEFTTKMHAVEVRGAYKYYGKARDPKIVLNRLCMTVEPGSMWVV